MPLRKDFFEILTSEFVSITGGLAAGSMLALFISEIYLIPGLLILLPGFLEMRGNISGSLASRLSSGLFLNAFKPRLRRNRVLRSNLAASFALVLIVSLVLGVLAYAGSYFLFGVSSQKIILIAVLAGILSNLIEIPLTVVTTFWLFRRGHDPNNIMGPYVTTTGDIISVLSLLAAMVIL